MHGIPQRHYIRFSYQPYLTLQKMNKIDQTTYSHLTKSQLTQLRKACKIANLDFKAMACRPKDGLQLIKDVENRTGVKL